MKTSITYSVILLASMVVASTTFAKGPTVQLSITGPGLSKPVHTSDADAIAVGVWSGDFFQRNDAEIKPSGDLDRYLVYFWVDIGRTVEMKYVVHYCWDEDAQSAFVYLPGPRDQFYRTNIYSIHRDGQNGKWYYATEQWGNAIRRILQEQ